MQKVPTYRIPVFLSAALCVAFASLPPASEPASGGVTPSPAQRDSSAFQFTGPGSCSSSSCHGSINPLDVTRIRQNEYSIWVLQDKHAKGYQDLTTPVAQRMARILGWEQAEQAPQCLACHALHVPEARRARTFSQSDGVSCENCHGPSSGWLGPHTTRGWTHQQSISLGMLDTKDMAKRTEACLSCHLGTTEKSVDHAMIAAGHPDLYFELDSFSAVMPPHWVEPAGSQWQGARAWGVGQAVQLRESLRQLERRAQSAAWPEYAELRCYSCHHVLTEPEKSWRQQTSYQGRRPGDPPWNASRYIVFRVLARMMDPAVSSQLDEVMSQIDAEASKRASDGARIAGLAGRAAGLADTLVARIQAAPFNGNAVLGLQHRICAEADSIASAGERAAEQAAMALNTLFLSYEKNVCSPRGAEIRAAIDQLFQQVRTPAAYRPDSFSSQMKRLRSLLDTPR